jgi:hypothetical protein
VKIARLHPLDLARIALLPVHEKRAALRRIRSGHPPYTYNPFRQQASHILGVEMDLPLVATRPSRLEVAHQIERAACGLGAEANISVANELFDFAEKNNTRGRSQLFESISIGTFDSVSYWMSAFISIQEKTSAVFIDPRRSVALTQQGRAFVFSMMHQSIRFGRPERRSVELVILQRRLLKNGASEFIPHFAGDTALLPAEILQRCIEETFRIWVEVHEERERERRKASGGPLGPLFE